jgi:hypothetical protein
VVALGGGSIDLAGVTTSSDFPGVVDASNPAFVANILINDPNHPSIPCLANTIQNAASFAEGAVAPGEVVTLRGKGIGPQSGVNAQVGANGFPTELAGVQVLFGNQPAALLYVQSEQINAMVPWETGSGSPNPGTSVEVTYNGVSINGSVLLNQTVRDNKRGRHAQLANQSSKTGKRGDVLRHGRRSNESARRGWRYLANKSAGSIYAAARLSADKLRRCSCYLRRFRAGVGIRRFPDQCAGAEPLFSSADGSHCDYDRRSIQSARDPGGRIAN